MVLIRDIVKQSITRGYLTVAAENQLRQLLQTKYDREDLKAFMTLQQVAMAGLVRQESRELRLIIVTKTDSLHNKKNFTLSKELVTQNRH